MISLLNVFIFVVYIYGLGYALTRFLKENSFETFVLRVATGLAAFPLLGVLFNALHIPLDWRIILIVSLAFPSHDFPRNRQYLLSSRLTAPSRETLLVLAFFGVNLAIYMTGAFVYPWLENDDSWTHAASIKYIAIEKNLNAGKGVFQYLNPYPPGYDLIFGILNQTHPSLYWTLKFFNAVIVSLSFPFFYFFVKEFSGSKTKAAWATIFLTSMPCYSSHFIWAHSLALTLFSPAFLVMLKAQRDKRYIIPAAVIVSGIFLAQPTKSIKFLLLFGFLLLAFFICQRFQGIKKPLVIFALGVLLSLTWWGPQALDYFQGRQKIVLRNDRLVSGNVQEINRDFRQRMFDPAGGSATRAYSWQDYFRPPEYNLINNPTGVGPVLCFLILLGLVFCSWQIGRSPRDQRIYYVTLISWFIVTFLGMNSKTFHLPVGLNAFRFWAVFALPAGMLAAEALAAISQRIGRLWGKQILLGLVFAGVVMTSGYYKFKVNMSVWPWGVYWNSPQEIRGYVWLRKNLPPNTKVFAFTDNLFVIGMDMHADFWSSRYQNSFADAFNLSNNELVDQLKENNFNYVVISGREIRKFGKDKIEEKVQALKTRQDFQLVYNINNQLWIFKLNRHDS